MPPLPSDCPEPGSDRDAVSRLTDTLKRHRMVSPGDSLLVAVSGGPDSVALIYLLHRIAPRWQLSLSIAHVDHGLRQDAAETARFVAGLAGRLGLPYHHMARDVAAVGRQRGMSIETAGRAVRYAFFSDLCIRYGYRRVAVGHHRDDCAEQILMNLARGAGPTGLAGIAPVRDEWVIRPLIDFSRTDILGYLSMAGHDYTQDPTNQDRRMTRNRIRHDILPVMASAINPHIVAALARTADIIAAENTWMDKMAADQLITATRAQDGESCTLSAAAVSTYPLPLQRRMLRLTIGRIKGDLQRIAHSHIDAILALIHRAGGSGTLHLPQRILVTRQYDRLILRRCRTPLRQRPSAVAENGAAAYSIRVDAPRFDGSSPRRFPVEAIGAVIALRESGPNDAGQRHSAGHCVAFFDMEKLEFPLILRSATHGDRFQPLGVCGTQKVYKLLKDLKIAPERRPLTPVLVSGDIIIWVPGVKMGQHAAVLADTRSVIRADFFCPRQKND
ncbi:MAG: tRNA lysidine(34) synthetase TilS [Pseudomonadota bacterium]